MKLKKIIYLITILTLLFFIVMLSIKIFNHNNKIKTTIIGNNIENLDYEVDDTFTSSFMTSSLLLKMLINDASKERKGELVKLSQLILNSNEIIINIGSVDLCNYIKEEQSLIYDEVILLRQSEITINNISKIVEAVNNISKNATIKINQIAYPYSIKDEKLISIFKDINTKINQMIDKHKTNAFSLSCFAFNK